MRAIVQAFLFVILVPTVLWAQEVVEPLQAAADGGMLDFSTLKGFGTTAAVGVATMIASWRVKRDLGGVRYLNAVPLYVYVIGLGIAFTAVGNRLAGTLEGDFWQLAVEGIFIALVTMGVHNTMQAPTKSLKVSADGTGDRKG